MRTFSDLWSIDCTASPPLAGTTRRACLARRIVRTSGLGGGVDQFRRARFHSRREVDLLREVADPTSFTCGEPAAASNGSGDPHAIPVRTPRVPPVVWLVLAPAAALIGLVALGWLEPPLRGIAASAGIAGAVAVVFYTLVQLSRPRQSPPRPPLRLRMRPPTRLWWAVWQRVGSDVRLDVVMSKRAPVVGPSRVTGPFTRKIPWTPLRSPSAADFQTGYYETDIRVCRAGHAVDAPAPAACPNCGMSAISSCPGCGTGIRGSYHNEVTTYAIGKSVPERCHACGEEFPWAWNRIRTGFQDWLAWLRQHGNLLTPAEREEFARCAESVLGESPQTVTAARRLDALLLKLPPREAMAFLDYLRGLATASAMEVLFP